MSVNTRAKSRSIRRAFTLVEMLIAMALTLILVYAIAEFYAYVGNFVKDGRAMIEMNNAMRTATVRLKTDLELLTVPVVPWADDGSSHGYFEIIEGVGSDMNSLADTNANGTPDYLEANYTTVAGDCDDILAATIRTPGEPFTGQTVGANASDGTILLNASGDPATTMTVAPVAEVAWWTSFDDSSGDFAWNPGEPRYLNRRQLLVRPDLNRPFSGDTNVTTPYFVRVNNANAADAYYTLMQYCDVSCRPAGVVNGFTYFVANSLLDLNRRENRMMRQPGAAFPNAMNLNPSYFGDMSQARSQSPVNDGSQWRWVLAGDRTGEDRTLSNLLAFDIRVFDPTAPLRADDNAANSVGTVQPGDPGWNDAVTQFSNDNTFCQIVGFGAFVDLNYNRYLTTPVAITTQNFAGPGFQTGLTGVYDTWALSYERDGAKQNTNALPPDAATNGLDDDGINGVDDPGERETSPPYPVPLRGIQVRIRMIEPGTRQVRQATVGADFIQE